MGDMGYMWFNLVFPNGAEGPPCENSNTSDFDEI